MAKYQCYGLWSGEKISIAIEQLKSPTDRLTDRQRDNKGKQKPYESGV